MSNLLKWQTISFLSRFFATVVGLVQSVIIVRILTPAEYGLVGIVNAVGNLTGVLKHLGLVSATTRELASSEDTTEAAKVFASALLIRAVVSLPLVLGLFFLADYLATNVYHQPAIALPIRIFAGVLLLQSFQEICNAVLAGRQRFKALFSFQAAIALVSFLLYVPLVYYLKVNGYFWAMLLLTIVSAAALAILALQTLGWRVICPRGGELKQFFLSLLGLGLTLYFGKILYMFWQKVGTLYLGAKVSAEEVGFFSFAILYATKMLVVSDAVTDVNLPAMTNHFRRGIEEFKQRFLINFEKVYSLMLLACVSAIFWSGEIFHLLVGTKYDQSLVLVPPLVLAFFVYGLLNLLDSSVLVPAKLLKELIIYHVVLLTVTGLVLVSAFSLKPPLAVSWAMALGGIVSLVYLSFICQRQGIRLWGKKAILPTLLAGFALVTHFAIFNPWLRGLVFLSFLGFYLWLLPYLGVLDWRRFFGREKL